MLGLQTHDLKAIIMAIRYESRNINAEQFIPYLLTRDLFGTNLETNKYLYYWIRYIECRYDEFCDENFIIYINFIRKNCRLMMKISSFI